MSQLFIWASFLLFSVFSFQYSYVIAGVNRSFLGAYKAVAELSVVAYGENGENIYPYFKESLFEEAVASYFDSCLGHYVDDYELKFSYAYSDGLQHSSSSCYEASFNLQCPLAIFGRFDKSAYFYIAESHYE